MDNISKSSVISASRGRESFVVFIRLVFFLAIYALAVNCVSWEANNFKTPASGRLFILASVDDNQTVPTNGFSLSKSKLTSPPLATRQILPTNSQSYLKITGTSSKLKSKKLKRNPRKLAETKIRRRRVVGGHDAIPHEFPFQALFLKLENQVHCGGTILNENFILTAASTFQDTDHEDYKSWRIIAGDHNWKIDEGTEQIRQIRDVHIHTRYRAISEVNNLAIVKLDRPLQLSQEVQPILLPAPDYEASGDAIVTGWGQLRYGGSNPLVLQKVTVSIVDRADCVEAYEEDQVFISVRMMCAGAIDVGGVDACNGDSGGPLSVQLSNGSFLLVGIVSSGIGCGRAEYPGIYTQVSKYIHWIDDTFTNFDLLTDDCKILDRCKHGGTCVDGIGNFSCICAYGFFGDTCEHTNKCRYHGECSPPIDAGNCHRCRDGFVKDPKDDTACKYANKKPSSLIISSRENTKMISLEGQTSKVLQNEDHVLGIDIKVQNSTMFWFCDSDKKIYTSPLKSISEKESIAHDTSSEILGLAIDWIHNHLYWVDTGKKELCVSDFSGTMKKVLIKDGLKSPLSIAVNPLNGWMYWTDEGENHIERAAMDGSQRKVILSTDIKEPQSIVVDFESSRLYWSQGWYSSSIWSSDFDGSDQKLIVVASPSQFHASYFLKIVTFDQYVYFIEYYSKTIYKVNKCNGGELEIVYKSDSRLWDVKIDDINLQSEGENLCFKRIDRCSHFCFPVPTLGIGNISTTTCACPDGLSLFTDNSNCV